MIEYVSEKLGLRLGPCCKFTAPREVNGELDTVQFVQGAGKWYDAATQEERDELGFVKVETPDPVRPQHIPTPSNCSLSHAQFLGLLVELDRTVEEFETKIRAVLAANGATAKEIEKAVIMLHYSERYEWDHELVQAMLVGEDESAVAAAWMQESGYVGD